MKRLFKNNEKDNEKLALEVCRTYGSVDAEAYLLERSGDWKGALVLLLNALKKVGSGL